MMKSKMLPIISPRGNYVTTKTIWNSVRMLVN